MKSSDRTEALRLLNAKNEAEFQPAFNAQLARTYLAAGDAVIGQRTWQLVMDTLLRTKEGSSAGCRARYERAIKQSFSDGIAKLLGISYSPVHRHIERIYQKLHVQSRGQAVAKYLGACSQGQG